MSDQLRALAEAEAAKIPQQPTITAVPSLPIDFTNKVREGFVQGFIAGRTSVTREQMIAAISKAMDGACTCHLDSYISDGANAALALLRGETNE